MCNFCELKARETSVPVSIVTSYCQLKTTTTIRCIFFADFFFWWVTIFGTFAFEFLFLKILFIVYMNWTIYCYNITSNLIFCNFFYGKISLKVFFFFLIAYMIACSVVCFLNLVYCCNFSWGISFGILLQFFMGNFILLFICSRVFFNKSVH